MTAVSPVAEAIAGLLTLPVWTLPELQALVHAERRPCWDVDPELFFPPDGDGPAVARQVARARTVCAACPVRAACLAVALAPDAAADAGAGDDPDPALYAPDGVWAGLTADERRAVASHWYALRRLAASEDVPVVADSPVDDMLLAVA
ncbi:transcription factor WhiB [Candidatus Protofrankia californiensis]|uniref:Transcription factor WhiB n=1 Tax=Candidatus Protofrankia californiensis TaxID=1839754 RepID=A0A1C3PBZ7_9ACTN|nr:transcription factor WhiB [Candidatus Protofrankia californiensis]